MHELDTSPLFALQKIILWCALTGALGCDNGAGKPSDAGSGSPCDTLRFPDTDGDGYGDNSLGERRCATEGWVTKGGDCDETDKDRHPGAVERCDGTDNNCDGTIDDDSAIEATHWFTDNDGDGYGAGAPLTYGCEGTSDAVANDDDCDDTSEISNPDAEEVCDEMDNDCDGEVDEGEVTSGQTYFWDEDGDGYGDSSITRKMCALEDGWSIEPGDCDESSSSVHPEAIEACDGVDQDCDGIVDNRCQITEDPDAAAWRLEHPGPGIILNTMTTADLTGDGVDDLLVAYNDLNVALFQGPLDEVEDALWSTPALSSTIGFGRGATTTHDLSGDGTVDLAMPVLSYGTHETSISVFFSPLSSAPDWLHPDSALILDSSFTWGYAGLEGMAAADFDHDGAVDIVFETRQDGGEIYLWTSVGEESTDLDDVSSWSVPREDGALSPKAGDFNGDGGADLVHARTSHELGVVIGPIDLGGGLAPTHLLEDPDETYRLDQGLCIADLDGDGRDNIGAAAQHNIDDTRRASELWIFAPEDSGSVPISKIVEGLDPQPAVYTCEDIDGDGIIDVMMQRPGVDTESGETVGAVHVFFGPLSGSVDEDEADRILMGETPGDRFGYLVNLTDYDGDEHQDLMVAGRTSDVLIFTTGDWLSPWWTPAASSSPSAE